MLLNDKQKIICPKERILTNMHVEKDTIYLVSEELISLVLLITSNDSKSRLHYKEISLNSMRCQIKIVIHIAFWQEMRAVDHSIN